MDTTLHRDAELCVFNAERAQRAGHTDVASDLYRNAAKKYAVIVQRRGTSISESDMTALYAASAVVCWCLAGDSENAIAYAREVGLRSRVDLLRARLEGAAEAEAVISAILA